MSSSRKHPLITAGIDVGGEKKGYHAVALADGAFLACFTSKEPQDVVAWCRNQNARVIGVDAPCRWSSDGRARPAERALMQQGMSCFSTPTRAQALAHPKNYFGWMLRGETLFFELEQTYPLCPAFPMPAPTSFCFETFPYAITRALAGGPVSAKQKRKTRTAILARAGLDTTHLRNIDFVDAALCALTAYHAATGQPCAAFGEAETGLIIIPAMRTPGLFTNRLPKSS